MGQSSPPRRQTSRLPHHPERIRKNTPHSDAGKRKKRPETPNTRFRGGCHSSSSVSSLHFGKKCIMMPRFGLVILVWFGIDCSSPVWLVGSGDTGMWRPSESGRSIR